MMEIFNSEFVSAVSRVLAESSANNKPITAERVAQALNLDHKEAANAVKNLVKMCFEEQYTTRKGIGGGFVSREAEATFREELAAKKAEQDLAKARRQARKEAKQATKERLEAEISAAVAKAEAEATSAAESPAVEEGVSTGLENYLGSEENQNSSEEEIETEAVAV